MEAGRSGATTAPHQQREYSSPTPRTSATTNTAATAAAAALVASTITAKAAAKPQVERETRNNRLVG